MSRMWTWLCNNTFTPCPSIGPKILDQTINNFSTLSFTFWTRSKTFVHIQNKLDMSKLFLNLKKDKSLSRKADSISEPWKSKGKLSTSPWISKLDFLSQDTQHHFWRTAELGRLGRTRCIRFLPKCTKAKKLQKSYWSNTHSLPRCVLVSSETLIVNIIRANSILHTVEICQF